MNRFRPSFENLEERIVMYSRFIEWRGGVSEDWHDGRNWYMTQPYNLAGYLDQNDCPDNDDIILFSQTFPKSIKVNSAAEVGIIYIGNWENEFKLNDVLNVTGNPNGPLSETFNESFFSSGMIYSENGKSGQLILDGNATFNGTNLNNGPLDHGSMDLVITGLTTFTGAQTKIAANIHVGTASNPGAAKFDANLNDDIVFYDNVNIDVNKNSALYLNQSKNLLQAGVGLGKINVDDGSVIRNGAGNPIINFQFILNNGSFFEVENGKSIIFDADMTSDDIRTFNNSAILLHTNSLLKLGDTGNGNIDLQQTTLNVEKTGTIKIDGNVKLRNSSKIVMENGNSYSVLEIDGYLYIADSDIHVNVNNASLTQSNVIDVVAPPSGAKPADGTVNIQSGSKLWTIENGTHINGAHRYDIINAEVNLVGDFVSYVSTSYRKHIDNFTHDWELESRLVEVKGKIWDDINQNGIQEINENGLAGITIYLYDSNHNQITWTVSDIYGNYSFANLNVGQYSLEIDFAGYALSDPDQTTEETDSDFYYQGGTLASTGLFEIWFNEGYYDAGLTMTMPDPDPDEIPLPPPPMP